MKHPFGVASPLTLFAICAYFYLYTVFIIRFVVFAFRADLHFPYYSAHRRMNMYDLYSLFFPPSLMSRVVAFSRSRFLSFRLIKFRPRFSTLTSTFSSKHNYYICWNCKDARFLQTMIYFLKKELMTVLRLFGFCWCWVWVLDVLILKSGCIFLQFFSFNLTLLRKNTIINDYMHGIGC